MVGAGAAGLTCARDLAEVDIDVMVLEAHDRIGGRIRTLRPQGEDPVELGASVVHGADAVTWEILRSSGAEADAIAQDSHLLFHIGDLCFNIADYLRAGGIAPWLVEAELGQTGEDADVASVLAALDVGPIDRAIAEAWLPLRWAGAATKLSDLGIAETRRTWASGAGEYLIAHGYDVIPKTLAAGLEVHTGRPVETIDWSGSNVIVDNEIRCDAVVVTVPPPVVSAQMLRFEPELSDPKLAACRAIDLDDVVVVAAMLSHPVPDPVVLLTLADPQAFWSARPGARVLLGWFRGAAAATVRALGPTAQLVERLTQPALPWVRVNAVETADWGADPYARGAHSYPRVGALAASTTWAAPHHDRLFFAGEATCGPPHGGLVQGAIESGRRAAAEVIAAQARRPLATTPASKTNASGSARKRR